ncbi:MAG: hypothetical protein ABI871_00815 [Chthoniobacterales bacterium]
MLLRIVAAGTALLCGISLARGQEVLLSSASVSKPVTDLALTADVVVEVHPAGAGQSHARTGVTVSPPAPQVIVNGARASERPKDATPRGEAVVEVKPRAAETSEVKTDPALSSPTTPLRLFSSRDAALRIEHAWIDLRQSAVVNLKAQAAPSWIDSVALVPSETAPGIAPKTVFRFRVIRPRPEVSVLMFRLFFDDKPEQHPRIIAWDESGTQIIQSGALGLGVDVPSSESMMIPMLGVSAIDVEVPGDGTIVRGAYLDWMANSDVLHPWNAEHRDLIREPFAVTAALRPAPQDSEQFGTVTATLAAEAIRMGPGVEHGATFQFQLESQPLVALLTFEVAGAKIDAPPEIFINGESVGTATLTLPDLADPGYRGESRSLVRQMQFQYTGWIRAQRIVPAANLKVGHNDVIVVAGVGTPAAAIRATQIQLKYLWEKSDYVLRP